ncbi:MAG: ComF family protein [Fusicatenibacter sp.]|nr:ComF family protein [Lachnospiraceae bacterium]MDY2938183.1 ComF family protein [Fusicatenibacter sp.]
MKKEILRVGSRAVDALYPRRCPICDGILLPKEKWVCRECTEKVRMISGPRCCKCSSPIQDSSMEYCRDCARNLHSYEEGFAAYPYRGFMEKSLMRYKYQGRMEYAGFYARSICIGSGQFLRRMKPDVLIPVPLHPARMRKRGYNQAEILAVKIGRELHLTVDSKSVKRIKNTKAQKELGRAERRKNLEHAFCLVPERISYRRILLVDDIYTTGSTIDAIASLLLERGAESVGFLAVAAGKGDESFASSRDTA